MVQTRLIVVLVSVMTLVVITFTSIANISLVSAQSSWIPCPAERPDDGVYMWGQFPVEESCVYATQSILDLNEAPRLKDGVDFLCESKPGDWLVIFYSEVNLQGQVVEYSNCGWTKLPWQPKSVQIERIEHIPPEVVIGPHLIFLPFSQNAR